MQWRRPNRVPLRASVVGGAAAGAEHVTGATAALNHRSDQRPARGPTRSFLNLVSNLYIGLFLPERARPAWHIQDSQVDRGPHNPTQVIKRLFKKVIQAIVQFSVMAYYGRQYEKASIRSSFRSVRAFVCDWGQLCELCCGCVVSAAGPAPAASAAGTLFICLCEVIKSFDQFYRLKFWSDQMNNDLVLRQDYLFELGYDNN